MKQLIRYVLPLLLVVTGIAMWGYASAQNADEPYEFELGKDITAQAGNVSITPGFKAIEDDRFSYEVYFNAERNGVTRRDGKAIETFRRSEHWTTLPMLIVEENPLDGEKDLQLRFQFQQLSFLINNGQSEYSGYIGPEANGRSASFHEILPNGQRTEANNVPGWVGMNARTLESNRSTQSQSLSASAWLSISDEGRLYNETYFADYNVGDQQNYPARLQDPVHIALGLMPEFGKETSLKIGESTSVRRRFPVGPNTGATIEYDFTYKLEKLYGTLDEPTAARFTFSAVPVVREHSTQVDGLVTSFTAPDIKGGRLLYDLTKGVAAHIQWDFALKGKVTKPGTDLATDFEVIVDFTASLRTSGPDAAADAE